MPVRLFLGLYLAALLVALAPRPAAAADDEYPTLSVRDHELNEALAAEGVKLHGETLALLERFEEQAKGERIGGVDLDAIGQVYVGSQQLLRIANRLLLLGEPAGVDLKLRAEELDRRLRVVMSAYLETPQGRARRENSLPALERRSQSHVRQVAGLARLADEEEWERAEEGLYEILDHLDELGVWYNRNQRGRSYSPYREARSVIEKKMVELRQAEAEEQIEGDLEAVTPDLTAFVNSLQTAARGLNAEGQTEYEGELLDGPQVASAWVERWLTVHQQVLQTHALQTALFTCGQNTTAAIGKLDRDYNNACRDAYQAIEEMIAADTNRVEGTAAAKLHAQYVAALAPLAGLTGDDAFGELSPALERLAGRSPEYQQEIATYRKATADYLRWQERIAQEEVAQRVNDAYPRFSTACVSAAQTREDAPGVLVEGDNSLDNAQLLAPLPEVTAKLREEMSGLNVSFAQGVGLGDGTRALVQYEDRGMAGVALPAAWAAAVDRLEVSLLCDERHPPLTLEAAGALASARRGDLVALGARIRSVELKGMIPFFATLPRPASVLTPLASAPGGAPNSGSISQVVLRYSLNPAWASHRYFLVTD